MENNPCQVSVIIINYNTAQLLKDCIQSVHLLTKEVHYEIIVVDNASNENPTRLLQPEFPDVRFINSSENLGFGRANNLGAQMAQGKYLLFLNSDTVLLNDAISILFRFMEQNPGVGIAGGNLYDEARNPVHSYAPFPNLSTEWRQLFSFRPFTLDISYMHNFGQEEKMVDYICGADLMISRELFSSIGGFDSDFFLYFEETEMTYRCRKLGRPAYSVPQACILHYHGMSTTKNGNDLRTWAGKEELYSKFLYHRKTGKARHPWQIRTISLTRSYFALFFYGLVGNKERVEFWNEKRKGICEVYTRYQTFVKNTIGKKH